MRTIAHISDLHFGRVDPTIAEALLRQLHEGKPTLTVVSGDFTQRARRRQYRAAAEYLHRLPEPRLVVPGNHDVPLYDVLRRFISPLGRYRRYITDDLQPVWRDDQLLVVGLRTARSFTHKGGWITPDQLALARRQLEVEGPLKVVVTHHPFVPAPNEPRSDTVGGAEAALRVFEACGVDLLLAGHLHLNYCGDIRDTFPIVRRSMLAVSAGTATSTRRRGEPNGYHWITISDRKEIEVETRAWNGRDFAAVRRVRHAV